MIEPTESEDRAELDRFCDALLAIRAEIKDVEDGAVKLEDSPLHHAPHTMEDVVTVEANARDAGVLFYAKVIEDYEPPTESGDDSAQQLVLREGELA